MNAPLRLKFEDPRGRISVVVDTRLRIVTANGQVAHKWDGDQLVMLTLLARAYPEPVSRDKLLVKIFTGRRIQQDPASCLRQTFKRVRSKLRPIGLDVVYTPHPEGSNLAGTYALGIHKVSSYPRRQA